MENRSRVTRLMLNCQGNSSHRAQYFQHLFIPKVIYGYLSATSLAGGQTCIYVLLWNILSDKVMLKNSYTSATPFKWTQRGGIFAHGKT